MLEKSICPGAIPTILSAVCQLVSLQFVISVKLGRRVQRSHVCATNTSAAK